MSPPVLERKVINSSGNYGDAPHLLVSAPRTTPSFQITAQMVVPVLVTWRWFTWIVLISSQASVHKCPLCSPLVAWNLALRAWHSFSYLSVCVFFAVVFAFELVFVFCISIRLCSPLVAWNLALRAWHSFSYLSVCVFFAVVFAFELVFVFCISSCLCSPLVAWSPALQAWHSSCSSQSWTRREAPPLASGSPSSKSANTLNRCHPPLQLDGAIAYKKIFSRHFLFYRLWGEGSQCPTVIVCNTLNSFHLRGRGRMSGFFCCSTWTASWCSCSSRCPSAWSSPPPSQSLPGSRALASLGERTCLQ